MYFNKQLEQWLLNYKRKYVKGSIAKLGRHGSHQGRLLLKVYEKFMSNRKNWQLAIVLPA